MRSFRGAFCIAMDRRGLAPTIIAILIIEKKKQGLSDVNLEIYPAGLKAFLSHIHFFGFDPVQSGSAIGPPSKRSRTSQPLQMA